MNADSSAPSIKELFDRASALHQAGQVVAAETLYQQILAEEPHHAHAIHSLGVIAYTRGQRSPAVDLLERAVDLAPKEVVFRHSLAQALRADGRSAEALQALKDAVMLNPEFVPAWEALAQIYYALDDMQASSQAIRKVAELKQRTAESYNAKGIELVNKGQLEEASETFQAGILCNPQGAGLYYNLGNVLVALRRFKEAVSSLKQAATLEPKAAAVHVSLSNALFYSGDIPAALQARSQALALEPELPAVRFLVTRSPLVNATADRGTHPQIDASGGQVNIRQTLALAIEQHRAGTLDTAEFHYRKVLAADPNNADAWHLLGVLSHQRGDHRAALALIDRAVTANDREARFHSNRALVLAALGEFEQADESCRRALALDVSLQAAHQNLEMVRRRRNERAESRTTRPDTTNLEKSQKHDLTEEHQKAVRLYTDGQYELAATLCEQILISQPEHAGALTLLGAAKLRSGDTETAVSLLSRSVSAQPNNAAAHSNLAAALLAQNRKSEALSRCEQALALAPDLPEALNNYGNTLRALGRYDDAQESFARAIRLAPNFVDAWIGQGGTFRALCRPEDALRCHDRALELHPNSPRAMAERAVALKDLGRLDEALATCDRALCLDPNAVDVLNTRGNILRRLQRYDEALVCYGKALGQRPDSAEILTNYGRVLLDLKEPTKALELYNKALGSDPGLAEAHVQRARAFFVLQRPEQVISSVDHALSLTPESSDAHIVRGAALHLLGRTEDALVSLKRALDIDPANLEALELRGSLLAGLKRYDEAIPCYIRILDLDPDYPYILGELLAARLHCCDWTDLSSMTQRLRVSVSSGKRVIQPFAYLSAAESPVDSLSCARIWIKDKCSKTPQPLWTGQRYKHDKIRVAYLSGNFRNHTTMYLMWELLGSHDKAKVDMFFASFGPNDESGVRAHLQESRERFLDLRGLSDKEAAQTLRDLEIDIAVDLDGLGAGGCLEILSFRPAPIQVNYLGFPGSSGADFIDYILADQYVIPERDELHYSEQVVYLPHCYQANPSNRAVSPHIPARSEVGLPQTAFVFCCFNNSYKITPDVFDIWMQLLDVVPNSVLWLLENNSACAFNLQREASKRGIAPSRLVFAPRVSVDRYLAYYRLVDVFLDTSPVNAHTTASDAIWMGVPLITCTGNTFAGRVAGSLLNAIGLSDLVTQNLDDYKALALSLAMNPDLLAAVRQRIVINRTTHPLFGGAGHCRRLESAYEVMWNIYQRGQEPGSFAVPPAVPSRTGDTAGASEPKTDHLPRSERRS